MPDISRKEREKQAREDEILDAAEKVFGKMGYEGALMEDIAREAQFTRKTLYQHFGGKEELLSAVVLRGFGRLLSRVRDSCAGVSGGFE
jgi:AcrR family transcriptional regulator